MTTAELIELAEQAFADETDLLIKKGADYSGNIDTLNNFKQIAGLTGAPKDLVWLVYFMKHVFAVISWCKSGRLESEPIESRIMDARNYLLLLLALIREDSTK